MEIGELRTVIKKVCRIHEDKEVDLMLDFYHNLGVIVKHGSTVVLQAQWLIDLLKQLITVPPFDKGVRCEYLYTLFKMYCLTMYIMGKFNNAELMHISPIRMIKLLWNNLT